MDVITRRSRSRTHTYQFSFRTSKAPEDVLKEVGVRRLPGIGIDEHGRNYLILRPQQRRRYGGDVAVLLAVIIVFAVLILTAVTPVFIALLPAAVLPAIPVLFDNRPDIAVSAVVDDEMGGTRVTVHGQAAPELAAALDAYLGSLPPYVPATRNGAAPSSTATRPSAPASAGGRAS